MTFSYYMLREIKTIQAFKNDSPIDIDIMREFRLDLEPRIGVNYQFKNNNHLKIDNLTLIVGSNRFITYSHNHVESFGKLKKKRLIFQIVDDYIKNDWVLDNSSEQNVINYNESKYNWFDHFIVEITQLTGAIAENAEIPTLEMSLCKVKPQINYSLNKWENFHKEDAHCPNCVLKILDLGVKI